MLIHNVYFWLRKDLTSAEKAHFDLEVRKLATISYLERAYVGVPAATEKRPVTDHSFDYSLSFHFKTLEDHEFYQKQCADHARFVSACKSYWERVLIYDVA